MKMITFKKYHHKNFHSYKVDQIQILLNLSRFIKKADRLKNGNPSNLFQSISPQGTKCHHWHLLKEKVKCGCENNWLVFVFSSECKCQKDAMILKNQSIGLFLVG